jgi:hypothetical protein
MKTTLKAFFEILLASTFLAACTTTTPIHLRNPQTEETAVEQTYEEQTYEESEIATEVADFFEMTTVAAGEAVGRIFAENGEPNAYITGNEGSGAIGVGLRYGEGNLYFKSGGGPIRVYWQGPSIGFDVGGNASKVFTLVYDLNDVNNLYQRFPGVEGSYYLIAGIGVNYQRADGVTLAPMRTGVGVRAGVNFGYLSYTRERRWFPF